MLCQRGLAWCQAPAITEYGEFMRIIKLLAVSVLALAGCKAPSEPASSASTEVVPSSAQCMKDTDCKGDRICEKGVCMAPSAAVATSAPVEAPAVVEPAVDPSLEKGMLLAMTLKPGDSGERMSESGTPLQAYGKAGILKMKPDRREDYVDYYRLIKPAELLGQEMIEIEEEYMTAYIGCCVDHGLGVTLKIKGNTSALVAFASANKCKLEIADRPWDAPDMTAKDLTTGTLVNISCRERFAMM